MTTMVQTGLYRTDNRSNHAFMLYNISVARRQVLHRFQERIRCSDTGRENMFHLDKQYRNREILIQRLILFALGLGMVILYFRQIMS